MSKFLLWWTFRQILNWQLIGILFNFRIVKISAIYSFQRWIEVEHQTNYKLVACFVTFFTIVKTYFTSLYLQVFFFTPGTSNANWRSSVWRIFIFQEKTKKRRRGRSPPIFFRSSSSTSRDAIMCLFQCFTTEVPRNTNRQLSYSRNLQANLTKNGKSEQVARS